VADLLRLGCHQLLALRLPVPVAVSATVDLAAATVGRRVTGLVNAVLRRVASHGLEDWLDLLCEGLDRLAALACRTAHPKWIAAVYLERLGWEEAAAALQANNRPPETVLAVRPGLASLDELAAQGARPGRWSPYAALADGDPGRFDAVRQGRAGVEDEGSQLVALGFAQAGGAVGGLSTVSPWPGPAERSPAAPPPLWLDLCAGPGGKAALLRGLAAAAGARLIANEAAPTRARLTAQALRAYPGPAAVVAADGRRPPWRPGVFDRVLADVPCTGLGALRRRPEARWRKSAADLPALTALQAGLLESALASCRPGGLVVYATCSPHPAETDALVEKVLARGGAAQVIPAAEVWPDIPDSAFGPYLQLWPHRHGADAMFAAVLRRR
jgi:16S rRNA (cytosine967-C5)-methyltransferase